jgi:hypothetical protein
VDSSGQRDTTGGARVDRGRPADIVRAFRRAEIRLSIDGDRILPTPEDAAPSALVERLADHRADVRALVAALPAPDRCAVCGDATGWADRGLHAHCPGVRHIP